MNIFSSTSRTSFPIVERGTEDKDKSVRHSWSWTWCEKVETVSMKDLLPNINWKGEDKFELLIRKSIRKVCLLFI